MMRAARFSFYSSKYQMASFFHSPTRDILFKAQPKARPPVSKQASHASCADADSDWLADSLRRESPESCGKEQKEPVCFLEPLQKLLLNLAFMPFKQIP